MVIFIFVLFALGAMGFHLNADEYKSSVAMKLHSTKLNHPGKQSLAFKSHAALE